jgi:melibiose permease
MMDIPYWSMIPAFTEGGKEREGLTTLARSCAGVGSALITIVTVISVSALGRLFGGADITGREIERIGFSYFSIIIAVLFVLFTVICCINVKEKSSVDMKTASIGEMFKALIQNDQAMAVVVAIVIVNCSIYITSNLVIYFFKYDFGGTGWQGDYTLFSTFGGAIQILAMMILYPLLRRFFTSVKIYFISMGMAIAGYIALLVLASTSMSNVFLLFIPAFFIFAANGMLAVITTVFLANTVDYGEMKNYRRDESVIFSMQTFVVKLASGISALIAALALQILALSNDTAETAALVDYSAGVSAMQKMGLRMTMTIVPICGLIFAIFWFKKKYILTDEKLQEISVTLVERKSQEMSN